MTMLFSTSPYDDATRESLVEVLDGLLLDARALELIAGRIERVMAGECEAICDLCRHLCKYADRLGDMSAALGGSPPGTAEEIVERHRIDDWPEGLADDDSIRRELADRVSQLSGWIADGVKVAGAAGAADVLVLLGKMLTKMTKCGWKIGRGITPTPNAPTETADIEASAVAKASVT